MTLCAVGLQSRNASFDLFNKFIMMIASSSTKVVEAAGGDQVQLALESDVCLGE